jgi:hypothetical protein
MLAKMARRVRPFGVPSMPRSLGFFGAAKAKKAKAPLTTIKGKYPPAGSMYAGPEPTEPAGGWPPFKGTPGPKQVACSAGGGEWIGPTGKKWCQLSVAVPKATPGVISTIPGTVTGAPSDTSKVPSGTTPGGGTAYGPPPGADGVEDNAVVDQQGGRPGPITMSATSTAPSSATSALGILAMVGVGGLLLYLVAKKGNLGGPVPGSAADAARGKVVKSTKAKRKSSRRVARKSGHRKARRA